MAAAESLDAIVLLYKCTRAHCGINKLYTYDELLSHRRLHHVFNRYTEPEERFECLPPKLVRRILKLVGLSGNERYDDVSKRIVCLCGCPTFCQPVTFSALVSHSSHPHLTILPYLYQSFQVQHVVQEQSWYMDMRKQRTWWVYLFPVLCLYLLNPLRSAGIDEETDLFDDHDFECSLSFLRLLKEGETLPSNDVEVPTDLVFPPNGFNQCKLCSPGGRNSTFDDVRYFVWHVRAK